MLTGFKGIDAKSSGIKSLDDVIDPVIFATIIEDWATEQDPVKRLVYAMDFLLTYVPHEISAEMNVGKVAKETVATMNAPGFDRDAYWDEHLG